MSLFKKLLRIKEEPPTPCVLEFRASDKEIQSIRVDDNSIYTLSNGIIKKWRKRDKQLSITLEKSDNTSLWVDDKYIYSGYHKKLDWLGHRREDILVFDKEGNFLKELSLPLLKGGAISNIFRIDMLYTTDDYIYGGYRVDFVADRGRSIGFHRIVIWDKQGALINDSKAMSPDCHFAMDKKYMYCLSAVALQFRSKEPQIRDISYELSNPPKIMKIVGGVHIYDISNPQSIKKVKIVESIPPHEILVDDKNVYLYKRRHIQVFDKCHWNTVWERKNKLLDEISKVHIDDKYMYVLHYGLKHKQLDIHDKYSGTIIKTIYAEDTINCVTTDNSNIYAGLSNGMIKVWDKTQI